MRFVPNADVCNLANHERGMAVNSTAAKVVVPTLT